MEVAGVDAHAHQIVGEILGHAFGESGDQHPLVAGGPGLAFPHKVVHLALGGTDFHGRVHQAGGPDDLFGQQALTAVQLPLAGRSRNIDGLMDAFQKFLKHEGAVVQGRGQAKTVIHQCGFAGAVALVHGAHLGNAHVRFVHEQQKIIGEIVQQGGRRFPGLATVKMTRIIFDAVAIAEFLHHFQVKLSALLQALSLHQTVGGLKLGQSDGQLVADVAHGSVEIVAVRHVMAGGVDNGLGDAAQHLAGERIDFADAVDDVPEKFQTQGAFVFIGGDNFQYVAAHAECAAMEVVVVAGVLDIHQVAGDVFHAHLPPFLHGNDQLGVIFGRAQTIDAGYRSHDDHVLAGQQGVGGGVAQFVDIVVDGRVFFDIGIGRGDVGFRLIIIIITDEIFHGVVRKQSPEFAVQLGGQSFIVGQH